MAINKNEELHRCVNDDPLSPEQQALLSTIWKWFIDNGVTDKDVPYGVASDTDSGHGNGKIYIDEHNSKANFPLGAVMLEEVLHYVTSSDRPETSADFSFAYLEFILQQIVRRLDARNSYMERRAFQSVLINELWRIIEKDNQMATIHSDAGAQSS